MMSHESNTTIIYFSKFQITIPERFEWIGVVVLCKNDWGHVVELPCDVIFNDTGFCSLGFKEALYNRVVTGVKLIKENYNFPDGIRVVANSVRQTKVEKGRNIGSKSAYIQQGEGMCQLNFETEWLYEEGYAGGLNLRINGKTPREYNDLLLQNYVASLLESITYTIDRARVMEGRIPLFAPIQYSGDTLSEDNVQKFEKNGKKYSTFMEYLNTPSGK